MSECRWMAGCFTTRVKSCADLIVRSYAQTYDLPVAIARFGNFFGGGDLNWQRIVPGTIRALPRGSAPDHSQRRHYSFATI